jgi:hypothetical protein
VTTVCIGASILSGFSLSSVSVSSTACHVSLDRRAYMRARLLGTVSAPKAGVAATSAQTARQGLPRGIGNLLNAPMLRRFGHPLAAIEERIQNIYFMLTAA